MADISKITLPSGTTYDLKDAWAREHISAMSGISFDIVWDGQSAPVVADIPAGVSVVYNGTTYKGTKAASTANTGVFYLVYSATQKGTADAFDEYVMIGDASAGTARWECIGNTQVDLSDLGNLAYKDTVTLNKSTATALTGVKVSQQPVIAKPTTTTKTVLGASTTFTVSKPNVTLNTESTKIGVSLTGGGVTTKDSSFITSIGAASKDDVLGANTTFTTTVTPTTTKISASAKGTAVATETADVVTAFNNPTTKSALGASATFSTKVTPTTTTIGVSVTDASLATSSKSVVTGLGTQSTVSVIGSSATLSSSQTVTKKSIKATATGAAVGANGTANAVTSYPGAFQKLVTSTASKVTAATSQTTATGGSTASTTNTDFLKGISYDSQTETLTIGAATLATQTTTQFTSSDVTVATGSTATTGTGSQIMTGLGTAVTSAVLTGVKMTAQPTISLAEDTAAGTGSYSVVTDAGAITTIFASKDEKKPITALTPTTADVISSVSIDAQPTVSIASGVTGGVTVATGITSATTSVSEKDAVTAITGLGTASTAAAVTSVSVSAQPTITIATGTTGDVTVATGITSATTSAGTNDKVSAVTGLGAATTAKALTSVTHTNPTVSITQGNTEGVSVLTGATGSLAAAPTVTVGTNDNVASVTDVAAPALATNVAVAADGTASVLKSDTAVNVG